MKNKIISIFLILAVIFAFAACGKLPAEDDGKLSIVCSIFAPYDFVKQIVGDNATVTMLLPPGVESHSYEPTPADIITLAEADIFFFVSEHTETWVPQLIDSVGNIPAVDLAEALNIQIHDHGHGGHHHNGAQKDEHIWTDLNTAADMVDIIAKNISQTDPDNAAIYRENAEKYAREIIALRDDFTTMIASSERTEIVSGSRFAMKNFAEEFNLTFTAAFDSCVDNTEPSAAVMAKIIDTINDKKLPVVFYEELTEPKIARAVATETGAKMLLLHSCHNVSVSEFKSGVTYLSLMRQNYTNIKEALN